MCGISDYEIMFSSPELRNRPLQVVYQGLVVRERQNMCPLKAYRSSSRQVSSVCDVIVLRLERGSFTCIRLRM
jgi:hypothetical protein